MYQSGDVVEGVLVGNDGWLFLWDGGQSQFKYLQGEPVARTSVESFTVNIASRKAICAQRKIPYIHIVFPSKPTVLPDLLPEKISGSVKSLYKRHYESHIDAAGLQNTCIYPQDFLIEKNKIHPVFIKDDTHNSSFGCTHLAQLIIESLGWDHDPFLHLTQVEAPRKGDLAQMAGIDNALNIDFYINRAGNFHSWDNLSALPGNTDNIVITHNPLSASQRRLLVVGDSFVKSCLEALSTYFRDILYMRADKFQFDVIDLFSPDAVVTSNAERYLCRVEPDAMAQSVLMRTYGRSDYNPGAEFCDALRAQLAYGPYPEQYRQWALKFAPLYYTGLGCGMLTHQVVRDKTDPEWLKSTGSDPQILFSDTLIRSEGSCLLRVKIESKVCGMMQLFIGNASGPIFSEKSSITRPVAVGESIVEFQIGSGGHSNKLRLDPLNCPGEFKIHDIELVEGH